MNDKPTFWQQFADNVAGTGSSHRLAAGVALGMVAGLIPADSLLPILLLIAITLLPVNLVAAGVSFMLAKLGGTIGGVTQSLDKVGQVVLQSESVINGIDRMYSIPMMPWLGLENTIVAGALVTGSLSAIPVYVIFQQWFERYGRSIIVQSSTSKPVRWLTGARRLPAATKTDRRAA